MGAVLDGFEARLPALRGRHLEPLLLEEDTKGIEDAGFVVDDQDRRFLAHAASSADRRAGKKIVKVVPGSAEDSTSTSPAVGIHRPLHNGQPQAGTAGPAGHEGLEEPFPQLVGNPRAVVPDFQPDRVGRCRTRAAARRLARPGADDDLDPGPRAACTALSSRLATTRCSRSSSPSIVVRPPCTRSRSRRRQSGCSRTSRAAASATSCRSTGSNSRRPDAGKIEKLAQQPAQPVALAHDELGQEPVVLIGLGRTGQLFHRAADRGQRVADLVGQRRAQSAATASSRSARRCSSWRRLESEISVKIAVTEGGCRRPFVEGGGREADGEDAAVRELHHALRAVHLAPVADGGDDRRPRARASGA